MTKLAFLTKMDKPHVLEAVNYSRKYCEVEVISDKDYKSFPRKLYSKKFDIIISYIGPWLIPKNILLKTKYWNINFHPGPPEYPGIGCFNFAIFNDEKIFGSTAHLMNENVDTGKIIGVKKFDIMTNISVHMLAKKTYDSMFVLYKETLDYIFKNNKLPTCKEKWRKIPYKRIELERLSRIFMHMSKKEMMKHINATYYQNKPLPYIEFFGKKYVYDPTNSIKPKKIPNNIIPYVILHKKKFIFDPNR